MPSGRIMVRADVNSQIGSGHFMRGVALAQGWQEHGGDAIFLMTPGPFALEKRLEDDNIDYVRLSSELGSVADAHETAAVALQQDVDWVVLDGYHFSPQYQRALKDVVPHVLLLDDIATADSFHADLLLNQNAYATPEMYADRAANCILLLGARYFLLRREFREWRQRDSQTSPRAQNLLVTFGGSDAENATACILQALELVSAPAMNVRVLIGVSNPHRAGLERLAAKLRHSVEFQTDTKQIATEMAWADLAASAAGSTSWELAFMGVPSLLITLSDNQDSCAKYLNCHGIAISLGWQHQVHPAETAAVLGTLAADPRRRADMSSRGRRLIDGRGVDRIVQAMDASSSAGFEKSRQ